MPFLARKNLTAAIREPHETEYRRKLRMALSDPTVSETQKVEIRKRLAQMEAPAEGATDRRSR